MTPESQLEIQYSEDGGGAWSTIKIFKGNNDNNRDFGFTSQAVDLPLYEKLYHCQVSAT